MADQSRENNPNWKGGRVVDPRGYVLIRVGKDHHLADVRGYAYEHRLKAEEKLGRRLLPDEKVHHGDEVKGNNAPENLEAMTPHEHGAAHRKLEMGLRMPGENNPEITCECGCGVVFMKFDGQGRPRRFLPAHNNRTRQRGSDGRMI